MDAILGMQVAAILFGLNALGGLALFGIRWSTRQNPPVWAAMAHGMLAVAAFTILLFAALTTGVPPLAQAALVLFAVAAAGGAWLHLKYHWPRVPLPISWIVGHGAIAAVAFVLLLAAVL